MAQKLIMYALQGTETPFITTVGHQNSLCEPYDPDTCYVRLKRPRNASNKCGTLKLNRLALRGLNTHYTSFTGPRNTIQSSRGTSKLIMLADEYIKVHIK